MTWKAAIVLGVVVSLALWAMASGANRQVVAVVVVVGLALLALVGDWLKRWAAGVEDRGDGDRGDNA